MIKAALQWLVSLGEAKELQIHGQTFSDKHLQHVPFPTTNPITLHTLSGLVDYVQKDYDNQPPVLIHVAGPTRVKVLSTLNVDKERDELVVAQAPVPDIPFDRFMDVERFNILLQSCFVKNNDRDALLAIIGNIADENTMTTQDDGVTQTVTAKTGIAQLGQVQLPNPVMLKPFRSFVEIEQPESGFVFRMRKEQSGPTAAIFEADGGEWRLQAIERIKDYLELSLAQEIQEGHATIIA